jgi:hypothetical protein
MNAISRTPYYSNDNGGSVRETTRASTIGMGGLGPNQLTWLRRNMNSFKDAEDQRRLMRQDVVRAARIAGLL